MSDTMRLRASVKVRNDHIIAGREALGMSQTALGKACGTGIMPVVWLERMRYDAYRNPETLRDHAAKIAAFLCIDMELVYPTALTGKNMAADQVIVSDVKIGTILGNNSFKQIGEPLDDLIADENLTILNDSIVELGPRAEKIVKMRYGISPYSEGSTLAEISKAVGLTAERVRHIEYRARRSLQRMIEGEEDDE